jgi:hypothetical protein
VNIASLGRRQRNYPQIRGAEGGRDGPAGLETLDTLIVAETAAIRAEAIRWSLDRIRERPAYQRLPELRSEADTLKNEF